MDRGYSLGHRLEFSLITLFLLKQIFVARENGATDRHLPGSKDQETIWSTHAQYPWLKALGLRGQKEPLRVGSGLAWGHP